MSRSPVRLLARLLALVLALGLLATACGDDADSSSADSDDAGSSADAPTYDTSKDTGPVTVRLGYFPNVTHAPAIVGVEDGLFAKAIGSENTLETKTFNAGPEATEAIFADALDISYIGPNPAINAFAKSNGEAIRIVAGSTSGGAALVTKPEITKPEDLKGTTIATPQLGNTQDVAARAWLKEEGLSTDTSGGGDVSIKPQANADTLTAFKDGSIDGAWVPEPWVTRLVLEGNGKVLVDEADLWPEGDFVTTHIIVRTKFLEEHPDIVSKVISAHLEALASIEADPAKAKATTNAGIEKITGKALADETIDGAWKNLRFTHDPIASSLQKSAKDAEEVGLLEPVDLDGIYELSLLNELLAKAGDEEIAQP
jgi:NitT/TauT family transport system substrate-binding protein